MDHLIAPVLPGSGGDAVAPLGRAYLRADVHLACIGPDAVLLDVGNDTYHCAPNGARLCTMLATDGAAVDERAVSDLAAACLTCADPPGAVRRPPSLPTRSVIHDARPLDLLRDLGPALSALRHVRMARRVQGLAPYLAMQAPSAGSDPADVVEASRRFWTLLPYLPIEGECLVRSALLMRFLRAQDLDADWVFGVRLHPFAAHCWVQVHDLCLNDDVERLTPYTPIMVL